MTFPPVAASGQSAPAAHAATDLEDFFENGAIGLHFVGEDGTILRANRAELEMMGYAREEYVGRNVAEFHVDQDVIADVLARLSRGETIRNRPARLRAKDGSVKHVLIDSSAHFRDGRFVNTRCFTRDVTQSRQAETAMRESEALLRAVHDSLDVAVFVLRDPGFLVSSANEAVRAMFGYAPSELIGLSTRVLHVDDAAFETMAARARRDLLATGAFRAECQLRRRDGTVFPTEHVARALRGPGGELLGFVTVIRDLTDKKRAEEVSARHAAIVESSDDAIISADREGRIVSWNRGAEVLYGYAAEEAIGRPVTFMMAPEAAATWPEAYARCLAGESVRLREVERLRKDGQRRTVQLNLSPLRDPGTGRVLGVSGIARDVTQRKLAEDAVRARARQNDALAHLGLQALQETDVQRLLDEVAQRLRGVLDVEYAKILQLQGDGRTLVLRAGAGWKEGIVGRTTLLVERGSQAGFALLSNEPVIVEDLRRETRFEPPQLLLEHGVVSGMTVIIHERGRPWGVLGVHATRRRAFTRDDVNFLQAVANLLAAAIQRKRVEEALHQQRDEIVSARRALGQAEKLSALGSLVSGVAHEIRTPLTSLVTGLSIIERRAKRLGDPTLSDMADNILRDADRIDALVENLRRFTRMEVGRREPMSLDVPATEALALYRATHKAGPTIHEDVQPTPPAVVDPAQVQQVVLNLVDNAAQACAGKPSACVRVHVGPTPDGKGALLRVEDEGQGIPPEVLARMYEPLFTTKPEGSGLGLAIVRRILDEHKATIECETQVGVGTVFRIAFPPAERAGFM